VKSHFHSLNFHIEFVEETQHNDVTGSKKSITTSPHPRSEVPNSFDAPHVHINPTVYDEDNVPGSPGESISAFPLATSSPPLEQSNQAPLEQGPHQIITTHPLEGPPQGHTTHPGTFPHTVQTIPGQVTPEQNTIPGQITPEQSTHVVNIPTQTTSQQSTPEKGTHVLSTEVEYPSISATPLEHSKSGQKVVTVPVLETSINKIKPGTVLIELPSKDLHLDRKGAKVNSKVKNGTVVKINGTLYLVKGSLTKLAKTKSAHANELVGSLLAGVAPKVSNEHVVNGTKAGITNDGEMFSYDGTASTTLEDKPFDAHIIKVKVKNEEQKNPPIKKLPGMS
jgi:hypothetical protein